MPKPSYHTTILSIHEAAERLGVSDKTLRRWEESGALVPLRSEGGHRRYKLSEVDKFRKRRELKRANKQSPSFTAKISNYQKSIDQSIQKTSVQVREGVEKANIAELKPAFQAQVQESSKTVSSQEAPAQTTAEILAKKANQFIQVPQVETTTASVESLSAWSHLAKPSRPVEETPVEVLPVPVPEMSSPISAPDPEELVKFSPLVQDDSVQADAPRVGMRQFYTSLHPEQKRALGWTRRAAVVAVVIFFLAKTLAWATPLASGMLQTTGLSQKAQKSMAQISAILPARIHQLVAQAQPSVPPTKGVVLGETTYLDNVVFKMNVPSEFYGPVSFKNTLTIEKDLEVGGNTRLTGDLAVNGGDITSTAAIFNIANTNTGTINLGGVSKAINIGGKTGLVTINYDLGVTHDLTVEGLLTVGENVQINGVEYSFPSVQGGGGTFLKNDGSGILTWETPHQVSTFSELTGIVPFSQGGTNNSAGFPAGSVIFSDGSKLTSDASHFFWDASNLRLGIGTSAPPAALSIGSSSQFQVDSTGAIATASGIGSYGTIQFSALNSGGVVYTDTSGVLLQTALPTPGLCLVADGFSIPGWGSCSAPWQKLSGSVISAVIATDDLAIGGSSTASAKFQIFGSSGSATTSGSLTFHSTGTNTINSLDGQALAFQTSGGGDTGLITRLFIGNDGLIGIGTTSPTANLHLVGSYGANSALIINQLNSGDLLTASASGVTRFTVDNSGNISKVTGITASGDITTSTNVSATGNISATGNLSAGGNLTAAGTITFSSLNTNKGVLFTDASGIVSQTAQGAANTVLHGNGSGTPFFSAVSLTADITGLLPIANGGTNGNAIPTAGGISYGTGTAYAFSNAGTSGYCLMSGGNGAPTWGDCGVIAGTQWDLTNGAIHPKNSTVDLLVGGTSTASAKFAVLNINSGTPTASLSAGTSGGTYLTADGTLATTNFRTLNLGDGTTGNIVLSPINGAGYVSLAGTSTFKISALNTAGGIVFVNSSGNFDVSTQGTVGFCLTSNGSGTPDWTDCSGAAGNQWTLNSNGTLYPQNSTVDLLVGGNSTASAKAAFLNINSGVPTASLSSGVAGGTYLTADGTLATTNFRTLNLGDGTTGNINLSPINGTGRVTVTGTSTLAVSALNTAGGVVWTDGAGVFNVSGQGSPGDCLTSAGGSSPTWGSCSAAANNQWSTSNGVLYPTNTWLDLSVGGNSTASAKVHLNALNGNITSQGYIQAAGATLSASVAGNVPLTVNGASGQTANLANFKSGSTVVAYVDNSGNLGLAGSAQFNANGSNQWDLAAGAGGFQLTETGVGTRFTVLPTSGNFGIGTTNPSALLSVGSSSQFQVNSSGAIAAATGITSSGTITFSGFSTANGILYTNGSGVLAQTGQGPTGTVLHGNGSSAPSFSAVSLTADVSGILPIANGGTNTNTTPTLGGVAYGTGTAYGFTLAGSSGQCLVSVGAGSPTWGACAGNSGAVWNSNLGAIFPANSTEDVLVGGQSTASAKFAFMNVNSGTPTASIAGSTSGNALTLTGDGTIATTLNRDLILNPSGAAVGIGTTTPLARLDVKGNGTADILMGEVASLTNYAGIGLGGSLANGSYNFASGPSDTNLYINRPVAKDIIFREANASTNSIIFKTQGSVGIGTITPLATLDVRRSGNGGTLPTASISGATSNVGLLVDNSGVGDLFTASKSGASKFTITNAGNVGIGTTIPTTMLDIRNPLSATGALASFDWSPSSSTTSTSDLFSLNVGANGTIGNIFNIMNNSSSVFSVSQNQITAALPVAFTAPGDVSVAYDLQFTNQTASYIKSNAPLYIDAGEIFENNDLTLRTHGTGYVIADTQALVANYAATVAGQLVVGTTAPATASIGNFFLTNSQVYGKSLAILNQTENQSIFSASISGVTKFVIDNLGYVGIGTSVPAATLDVRSLNGVSPTASISGRTTNAGLVVDNSGTGDLFVASSSGLNRFVITQNGRVGIGTTLPSESLQVVGGAVLLDNAQSYKIKDNAGNARSVVSYTSSNNLQLSNLANSGSVQIGNFSNASNTTGLVLFYTNNSTERFRIDGNGLMGNTTLTPLASLDITAKSATLPIASFSGSTNFAGLIADNSGTGDLFTASKSGASKFTVLNNGNVQINNLNTAGGVVYTDSTGILGTTNGTAGFCLVAGVSAPTWSTCSAGAANNLWTSSLGAIYPVNSTMDMLIGGQSTASAKFAFMNVNSGTPTASIAGSTSGNALTLTGDGTIATTLNRDLLFNPSGGNVGIGTTTPQTLLHVHRTAVSSAAEIISQFTVSDDSTASLKFNNSTTTDGAFQPAITGVGSSTRVALNLVGTANTDTGSTPVIIINSSAVTTRPIFDIRNSATSKFLISAAGNIGVGTISPLATLDVRSQTATIPIASFSGATTNAGLIVDNSGTGDLFTASSSGLNRFVITQNGNVGIGTSIPTHKLDIITSSGLNDIRTYNGTSDNVFGVLAGGTAFIGNNFAQPLAFYTNGAEKARIDSNGSFGIGTTSPLAALDVRRTIATLPIASFSGATTNAGLIVDNTGTGDLFTASKSGSSKFTITNAGNVGIGTTIPTTMFDIRSPLSATGALASFDWSPSSSTTSTSDLFSLNVGANGTIGNIFNVMNGGSSVFAVGQNQITANLPVAFTAPGDVSVAYDLQFTNTTASFIKSLSSLTLETGEVFNSSDLTLRTFNSGNVVVDSQAFVARNATFSGQVAIGTTSPDSFAMGGFYLTNGGTYNKSLAILNQTENQSILSASISGVTKFVIDNLGYVGIGTSVPAATLDVRSLNGVSPTASISGATSHAGLLVDNSGLGSLFTASKSGATKFTILNSGDVQINNLNTAGGVVYTSSTGVLATTNGTAGFCLVAGVSAPTWSTCSAGAANNLWTSSLGAIYPVNSTMDMLIGGQSTASAKFSFLNVNNGTPVASVSSGTSGTSAFLTADGTLGTQNRMSLTLGNSSTYNTTGNILLNPNGTGNVGIGTTVPATKLHTYLNTAGSSNTLRVENGDNTNGSSHAVLDLLVGGTSGGDAKVTFTGPSVSAWGIGLDNSDSDKFKISPSITLGTTDYLTITTAGLFGINNSSPLATFDIRSISGTLPIASISGATTNAGLIVDNSGTGDIFTASSSGLNRFVVKQSGQVGIGTTLPLAKLHSDIGSGAINNVAGYFFGSTNTGTFSDSVGNNKQRATLVVGTNWTTTQGNLLNIYNANTDGLLFMNAAGQMSMGTTTPLATFDVRRSAVLAANLPIASFSGATTNAGLIVDNSGTGDIFTASSSGLNRFVIKQSGNVGIGTTLPTAILDVANTSTGLTSTGLASFNWSPTSATINTGDLVSLDVGSLGTIANIFNVKNNGSSVFSVGQSLVTSALPVNITAPGDVSYAYDIQFTNPISSFIKSAAPLALQSGEVFNSSDLTLKTFNSGQVVVDSQVLFFGNATASGQLVIGSTAPDSANIGNFFLTNSQVYGKSLAILNQTENQSIFSASISGVTKFVIDNIGYVGIGTSVPTATLDVRALNAVSPIASISGRTTNAGLVVDNSGTGDLFVASSSGLNRFVVTQNGSVGIGTSIPSSTALLEVNRNSATSFIGTLYHNPNGSTNSGISIDFAMNSGTTTNAKIAAIRTNAVSSGDADLAFSTNLAGGSLNEVLRLTSAKTVGINTSSPLATFDVRSQTGTLPTASISGSTSNAGLIVDNNGLGDIFTASSSGLNRFVVKQSGKVGIGTTLPSLRLEVQDTAAATAAAMINNLDTGTDADGLAIKLGFTGVGTIPSGSPAVGNRFLTFLNGNGNIQGAIQSDGANGVTLAAKGIDFAEYFTKDDPSAVLPTGTVVCQGVNGVRACQPGDNGKVVGIVSAHPIVLGGTPGDNKVIVALTGQVPMKVTNESGMILSGDTITYSSKSGVGGKQVKAGSIVGRALEPYYNTDPNAVGEIMVNVSPSYFDPDTTLAAADLNNYTLTPDVALGFVLKTPAGQVLDKVVTASNILVANLQAGTITAKTVNTDELNVAGMSLDQYIAQVVDQMQAQASASAALANGPLGVASIPTATTSSPLSASASASLADALTSTGTAASIEQSFNDITLSDTDSKIVVAANQVDKYLDVKGSAFISGDLGVGRSMVLGRGLSLTDQGVDFTSAVAPADRQFNLLASGKGSLNILSGLMTLNDQGKVNINGDVNIAGRLTLGDQDGAGFAVIKQGDTQVQVVFTKAYAEQPVITATSDNADIQIGLKNKSKTGFTIYLKTPATQDEHISWTAVAIKNVKTFNSDGTFTTATQSGVVAGVSTSSGSLVGQ